MDRRGWRAVRNARSSDEWRWGAGIVSAYHGAVGCVGERVAELARVKGAGVVSAAAARPKPSPSDAGFVVEAGDDLCNERRVGGTLDEAVERAPIVERALEELDSHNPEHEKQQSTQHQHVAEGGERLE